MDRNYDMDAEYRHLPLLPLPTSCPGCSAVLEPGKEMKSTWSRRILFLGITGNILLIVGLYLFWPQLGLLPELNTFRGLNWDNIVLLFIPLLLVLWHFVDSGKVIFLKCRHCSWEEEFLAKNREKFAVEKPQDNRTGKSTENSGKHPVYIISDGSGAGWDPDFGQPPEVCPECHQELIEPRARRPRWVILVVVAVGLHATVGMRILVAVFDSSWLPAMQSPGRDLVFLLVGILPLIVGAWRYRGASRVLPFECFNCGWKHNFSLKENRSFDLPDEKF